MFSARVARQTSFFNKTDNSMFSFPTLLGTQFGFPSALSTHNPIGLLSATKPQLSKSGAPAWDYLCQTTATTCKGSLVTPRNRKVYLFALTITLVRNSQLFHATLCFSGIFFNRTLFSASHSCFPFLAGTTHDLSSSEYHHDDGSDIHL